MQTRMQLIKLTWIGTYTNIKIGDDNSYTTPPPGDTGEATDQDMLAPDCSPHPPQTSWAKQVETLPQAWLLPIGVVRLHAGDLHAVGWGEGP